MSHLPDDPTARMSAAPPRPRRTILVFDVVLHDGATLMVIGQTREEFLTALNEAFEFGEPFLTAQVVGQGEGWQRRATFRADAVTIVYEERTITLDPGTAGGRPVPVDGGGGAPDIARPLEPWEVEDDDEAEYDEERSRELRRRAAIEAGQRRLVS